MWRDFDTDGQGDPSVRTAACAGAAPGWVTNFLDCKDTDPSLFAGDGGGCPNPPPAEQWAITESTTRFSAPGARDLVVVVAGDLDGDGADDLMVLTESDGTNRLSAVFGSWEGTVGPEDANLFLEDSSLAFVGGAGDVDGDGDGDVVVAVNQELEVFRVPLAPGRLDPLTAAVVIPVAASGVAPGGDADGDGAADLWVVNGDEIELYDVGSTPAVGEPSVTLAAVFSPTVHTADLDGDGVVELAVAAEEEPYGVLWILSTPVTGVVDPAADYDVELLGHGFPLTKWSVHAGGDLDGDGRADVVVTTREGVAVVGTPAAGSSLLISAARAWLVEPLTGTDATIAAPGDLDGDGFHDLAIGFHDVVQNREAAHILSGPLGGTVALDQVTEWYGIGGGFSAPTVAGGDLDHDGVGDLVFGSSVEPTAFIALAAAL